MKKKEYLTEEEAEIMHLQVYDQMELLATKIKDKTSYHKKERSISIMREVGEENADESV